MLTVAIPRRVVHCGARAGTAATVALPAADIAVAVARRTGGDEDVQPEAPPDSPDDMPSTPSTTDEPDEALSTPSALVPVTPAKSKIVASTAPASPPATTLTKSVHNASASALGYLHQIRWGLYELVKQSGSRPDLKLTLEMHDDVAFEKDGALVDLQQLKLHTTGVGDLADKSTEIWRTLGVWLDHSRPGDPLGPALTLITNATAPAGSAAEFLRLGKAPNSTKALELLEAAASTSNAKVTERARKKFLALDPSDRAAFVAKIRVADASLDIAGVEEDLRGRLALGVPPAHFDLYMDHVWGWWSRTALAMLQGVRDSISVAQMREELARIRDTFSVDNLPVLVDRDEVDLDTLFGLHVDRLYIQQMRAIGAQSRQLANAITDYQRAYLQRTRWLDEDLVGYSEVEDFTDKLVDEWVREFDFTVNLLSNPATADDKRRAGMQLLRTLSDSTLTIRSKFTESFYARGERHALADTLTIGWHPDFATHLEALLLGAPPPATAAATAASPAASTWPQASPEPLAVSTGATGSKDDQAISNKP